MIHSPAPRAGARILSVAGYRSGRIVSNEEMCTMVESTPEWIEQRTGIVERRWVSEGETLEHMFLTCGAQAIQRAGIEPSQVGALICATVSHYQQTPSIAVTIADKLGLGQPGQRAAAWDISAACAGFCFALAQADALVRAGTVEYVLIIGGEVLTQMTDVTDRGTAFLLADGAGSVVVGPSDEPGIGPVVWGSDGAQATVIETRPKWQEAMRTGEWPNLHMEGRKVFKWAITAIAERAQEALDAAGIRADELDVFIPHQANNRIIDSMLKHLHLPETVHVARDIRHLGNTSAASIPLAMEAALASGAARSGQTALIIGFGAGLVYAGQVVRLPSHRNP